MELYTWGTHSGIEIVLIKCELFLKSTVLSDSKISDIIKIALEFNETKMFAKFEMTLKFIR